MTALVAEREIARAKAEGNEEPVIIYNLITSRLFLSWLRSWAAAQ